MAIRLSRETCPVLDQIHDLVICGNKRRKFFKGSDRQSNTFGSEFIVTTNKVLFHGSVYVYINGLLYTSGENQEDVNNVDFHITNNSVIIHDKGHGGTINIIDRDLIAVTYNLEI